MNFRNEENVSDGKTEIITDIKCERQNSNSRFSMKVKVHLGSEKTVHHWVISGTWLQVMSKQDALIHWDEIANKFSPYQVLNCQSSQLLRYYAWSGPLTIQPNTSQRGLGDCLVQEGQLIAFASKSLTDTEIRYANKRKLNNCICMSVLQYICTGKAIYSGVRP